MMRPEFAHCDPQELDEVSRWPLQPRQLAIDGLYTMVFRTASNQPGTAKSVVRVTDVRQIGGYEQVGFLPLALPNLLPVVYQQASGMFYYGHWKSEYSDPFRVWGSPVVEAYFKEDYMESKLRQLVLDTERNAIAGLENPRHPERTYYRHPIRKTCPELEAELPSSNFRFGGCAYGTEQ